nr:MAG TPA: hypothetical protein [Caudoviricetes sp.]
MLIKSVKSAISVVLKHVARAKKNPCNRCDL